MPGKRAVMLVDDDPLLARVIVRMLLRLGFDVRVHETGAEALADLARGTSPDAILLDMHLPDMSGHDVHGRIRTDHPELEASVVFLTGGSGGDPEIEAFLDAHRERVLPKPFSAADLSGRLHLALGPCEGPGSE